MGTPSATLWPPFGHPSATPHKSLEWAPSDADYKLDAEFYWSNDTVNANAIFSKGSTAAVCPALASMLNPDEEYSMS